jgi:protoheme ferro-lyase
MMTRHVVLLTYGEPPTPAFVDQLVYSWRILLGLTRSVAEIPPFVMPMIALSRARFRNRLWSAERYGSPLEAITRAQAERLAAELGTRHPGERWSVRAAYEFRRPLLIETLESIPADEEAIVVPMYAADSAFTHELSRRVIAAWSAKRARATPVRVLGPIDEVELAEASVRHVERELESRGIVPDREWALVLAAHGTLVDPPKPIDTGRVATERLAAAILARIGGRFGIGIQGWLNHVYGGRWTEPAVEDALAKISEKGFRKVVYYPFGFLADNAESELEGRLFLRAQPELQAVHLPCVNLASEFIAVLAEAVGKAASSAPAVPRAEPEGARRVASLIG